MPPSARRYALLVVRGSLVLAGLGLLGVALYALVENATTPARGDGFVTGLAWLVWTGVAVVAVGVAGLGGALPALLGVDGGDGLTTGQRRLLLGGGVVVLLGFLVGLAGFVLNSFVAFVLAALTIPLGVGLVCTAFVWRIGEAIHARVAA
jgi:hypothetical protein